MQPTRREFLKAGTLGGVAVSVLGFDLTPAYAQVRELKIARTRKSTPASLAMSCSVTMFGWFSAEAARASRRRRRRRSGSAR